MSLKVEIISCRNLKDEDKIGKSDPYVEIEVGHQKYRSTTKKDTLNPVFNETFQFDGISNPQSKKLEIT